MCREHSSTALRWATIPCRSQNWERTSKRIVGRTRTWFDLRWRGAARGAGWGGLGRRRRVRHAGGEGGVGGAMCPHARDRSGREQGRPASRTLGLRPPRRARARWLARDAHCTKGFAIGSRPSAGATSVTHVPRHTVRPSGRRSSVTTPASAGSRSDSTVSSSTRLRISSYPWRARAAAWRWGARVGASQPRSCMVHARGADDVQIGRSAAAQRCARRKRCPPQTGAAVAARAPRPRARAQRRPPSQAPSAAPCARARAAAPAPSAPP